MLSLISYRYVYLLFCYLKNNCNISALLVCRHCFQGVPVSSYTCCLTYLFPLCNYSLLQLFRPHLNLILSELSCTLTLRGEDEQREEGEEKGYIHLGSHTRHRGLRKHYFLEGTSSTTPLRGSRRRRPSGGGSHTLSHLLVTFL